MNDYFADLLTRGRHADYLREVEHDARAADMRRALRALESVEPQSVTRRSGWGHGWLSGVLGHLRPHHLVLHGRH